MGMHYIERRQDFWLGPHRNQFLYSSPLSNPRDENEFAPGPSGARGKFQGETRLILKIVGKVRKFYREVQTCNCKYSMVQMLLKCTTRFMATVEYCN